MLTGTPSRMDRLRRAARAAFTAHDEDGLEAACEAIIQLNPSDSEARRLLGRHALRRLDLRSAETLLREAAACEPASPAAWVDLARALVDLRREAEAEAVMAAAAARGVRSAGLLTFTGVLRLALGRPDDAEDAFLGAVDADPKAGDALRWLAELGALTPGEPIFRHMVRRLKAGEFDASAQVSVLYALAEAAARAGDRDAMWAHLEDANARQAAAVEPGAAMLDTFKTASKAARLVNRARETGPESDPPLVFVLGAPGSGAALAEQALGAIAKIRVGGAMGALSGPVLSLMGLDARAALLEAPRLSGAMRTQLAERYLARIALVEGKTNAVVSDSHGDNVALAPLAAAVFANARFVVVRRDVRDAGATVWRRAYAKPRAHECVKRDIGRVLALSETAMANLAKARDGVAETTYDALLDDPVGEGRRLADTLGLDLRDTPRAAHPLDGGLECWEARRTEAKIAPGRGADFAAVLSELFKAAQAPA